MVESHHYLELGSCNPPMHIAKVLFPNHFKDPSATLNAHLTTRVIYPLWSYKTWCSFQFCLGKSMIISNHKKLALLFSLKTSLMTLSRFYCTITPHFFLVIILSNQNVHFTGEKCSFLHEMVSRADLTATFQGNCCLRPWELSNCCIPKNMFLYIYIHIQFYVLCVYIYVYLQIYTNLVSSWKFGPEIQCSKANHRSWVSCPLASSSQSVKRPEGNHHKSYKIMM